MPFDQKRINGPETSFSYKDFIERSDDKVKLDEKRADGRKNNEHRKFGIKVKLKLSREHSITNINRYFQLLN